MEFSYFLTKSKEYIGSIFGSGEFFFTNEAVEKMQNLYRTWQYENPDHFNRSQYFPQNFIDNVWIKLLSKTVIGPLYWPNHPNAQSRMGFLQNITPTLREQLLSHQPNSLVVIRPTQNSSMDRDYPTSSAYQLP